MIIANKIFVLSGLEEPISIRQKLPSPISESNVTQIYRYVFMNINSAKTRLIFFSGSQVYNINIFTLHQSGSCLDFFKSQQLTRKQPLFQELL